MGTVSTRGYQEYRDAQGVWYIAAMRIATWNVNGIRARLDYVRHWLQERQPDVVGIQELKSTDDQFPFDELRELGYEAVTWGQKAWNGVAVLSRGPAILRQAGLPSQDDLGARLLAVDIGELCFATVYCPNGKSVDHPDFPTKLAWFDALVAFVESFYSPDGSIVLCGDFNVVPQAVDSYNEAALRGGIFHTDEERERVEALKRWGFVDLFREKNPDVPGFTWWDYRAGAFHRKKGLRIDLMLGTRAILDRTRFVHADRDWRKKVEGLTPSDHCPVYADLE